MKKIAVIFSQAPHGNTQGREALDAALSLSDINQISIFFIDDGVFHLLENQQPEKILCRDYIATLGMLDIYDITDIYVCKQALAARHLLQQPFTIEAKIIDKQAISALLAEQDGILKF